MCLPDGVLHTHGSLSFSNPQTPVEYCYSSIEIQCNIAVSPTQNWNQFHILCKLNEQIMLCEGSPLLSEALWSLQDCCSDITIRTVEISLCIFYRGFTPVNPSLWHIFCMIIYVEDIRSFIYLGYICVPSSGLVWYPLLRSGFSLRVCMAFCKGPVKCQQGYYAWPVTVELPDVRALMCTCQIFRFICSVLAHEFWWGSTGMWKWGHR